MTSHPTIWDPATCEVDWGKKMPPLDWTELLSRGMAMWVWVNTYRYIFSGMNIHLPAILGFTRYQGFDPSPCLWMSSAMAPFPPGHLFRNSRLRPHQSAGRGLLSRSHHWVVTGTARRNMVLNIKDHLSESMSKSMSYYISLYYFQLANDLHQTKG